MHSANKPGKTRVAELYREWRALFDYVDATKMSDEQTDAHCDELADLGRAILKVPCENAGDFTMKVLVSSGCGDWRVPDIRENPGLWAEADALV